MKISVCINIILVFSVSVKNSILHFLSCVTFELLSNLHTTIAYLEVTNGGMDLRRLCLRQKHAQPPAIKNIQSYAKQLWTYWLFI